MLAKFFQYKQNLTSQLWINALPKSWIFEAGFEEREWGFLVELSTHLTCI